MFEFTKEATRAISNYLQSALESMADLKNNRNVDKTTFKLFTSDVEQNIRFLAIQLSRARKVSVVERRDVEEALRKLKVELFRARKRSPTYYKQLLNDINLLQERLTSLENPQILDLGCGWGKISRIFSQKIEKAEVVGIDLDILSLKYGRFLNCDASFLRADMRHLPFKPLAFDMILSGEALHEVGNVDDLKNVLRELNRVLNRHGLVYVFDPFARFRIVKLIQRLFRKIYPKMELYLQEGEFESHLREERFKLISKSRYVWPEFSFRVYCSYIALNT